MMTDSLAALGALFQAQADAPLSDADKEATVKEAINALASVPPDQVITFKQSPGLRPHWMLMQEFLTMLDATRCIVWYKSARVDTESVVRVVNPTTFRAHAELLWSLYIGGGAS